MPKGCVSFASVAGTPSPPCPPPANRTSRSARAAWTRTAQRTIAASERITPPRLACLLGINTYSLHLRRRGADVGEDLGRPIGVGDRIERDVADELLAEHAHRQAAEGDVGELPLLRDAMTEARLVV